MNLVCHAPVAVNNPLRLTFVPVGGCAVRMEIASLNTPGSTGGVTTAGGGTVRGRLAPSPTGHMHLGNAWAFMLAWLAARSVGGDVVLRMEDIDPDRAREAYAVGLMCDIEWLGLDWDEGPDKGGPHQPYVQSARLDRYAQVLQGLVAAGHVYPCYCTRKELRSLAGAPHPGDAGAAYPGTCRGLSAEERQGREQEGRSASMRVHWPDVAFRFDDLLHGPQSGGSASSGGDFAVRRSDGVFAYQLAVVVDDIDMGVTQVVRGDDLMCCTPRQLLLYHLLGARPPSYLHVPLLLDAEGQRLAKRHRSLEIRALREAGVPAAHVTGYLAWCAGLAPYPQPLAPEACLDRFDIGVLPRGPVTIPANITEVLRGMRS